MMASGVAPVLSLGLDSDPSKQTIVGDYLNDVVAVILTSLEARSRAIRQPSTASVFLLNNIGHLRRSLSAPLPSYLGATEDGGSVTITSLHLGEMGDDLLATAMRQANTAYLDAWSPVVAPLMEDQPLNANAHYTAMPRRSSSVLAPGPRRTRSRIGLLDSTRRWTISRGCIAHIR